MTTIKAIVRNGRIEVDEPIDLPDGTELRIPIPDPAPPFGKGYLCLTSLAIRAHCVQGRRASPDRAALLVQHLA
jgi:hypothetical protein